MKKICQNMHLNNICENKHWWMRHISRHISLDYCAHRKIYEMLLLWDLCFLYCYAVMLLWRYRVLYFCTPLCFWETFCNYPTSVHVYVQCVCCCSVSENGSWGRKSLEISPVDTAWMHVPQGISQLPDVI